MNQATESPSLLKLNLGCGPVVVDGWQNLDKSPNVLLSKVPLGLRILRSLGLITDDQAKGFPPGVKFADHSKRLPYADQSVGHIYSGHLVEHISPLSASRLLSECRRVLAPGGIIRFSTPDLRELADEYIEAANAGDTKAADAFMKRLGTYVESNGNLARRFINRNISAFHHQWLYDEATLKAKFEAAGFVGVEARSFRDDAFPDLEHLELRPGGLFVQATVG